jgi:arginine decarboxylase-like protein
MQSESAAEETKLTRVAQPYHVTVTKNAKGSYQWEVSIYSETADDVLASVEYVEKELRARYGSQGGE